MFRRLCVVVLLMAAPVLGAQRGEYILSTAINVTAGVDNRPQTQIPTATFPGTAANYGAFPTISLNGRAGRSSLGLSYSYGYNRIELDEPVTNQSHSADASYNTNVGRNWSLTFSDSFESSGDAATYNALRGVSTATSNGIPFFYPVLSRLTSRNNNVGTIVDRTLGLRSSLIFTVNYAKRDYVGDSASRAGRLSNQESVSAGITFRRRLGQTDTLDFGYTGSYLAYEEFSDSRTDGGTVTYTTVAGRDWRLSMSGGATQVRSKGEFGRSTGINAAAGVGKDFRAGTFFTRYSRDTGQQSGLGSTSNSQRFVLSWTQSLSQVSTLFIDGGMFDSQGILDNNLNSRGYNVAANVGYNLSPKFSLHFGGQFQKYTQPADLAFLQKKLFVSLRYTEPRLLGFLVR